MTHSICFISLPIYPKDDLRVVTQDWTLARRPIHDFYLVEVDVGDISCIFVVSERTGTLPVVLDLVPHLLPLPRKIH